MLAFRAHVKLASRIVSCGGSSLQSRPHRQTDVPVRAHVTVTVTHSSVSSSVTADDVIVTSRDTVLRHDYTSL